MNPETINEITRYLDKIGEKIGQGAETVWPWLVKQQIIYSYTAIICFIVFLAGFFFSTILARVEYLSKGDCGAWTPVSIIFGFCLFISIFGIFLFGLNLLNPEYWALKDLLYMVNPK